MIKMLRAFLPLMLLAVVVAGGGCKKKMVLQEEAVGPDYNRKLRPGESALRLIPDPARWPNIAAAYQSRDVFLLEALDQSIDWFKAPSSKTYFPFENIATHEQANQSVNEFAQILQSATDENDFVAQMKSRFNCYESVGYNGEGIVLFTGYYSPIFRASKTPTAQFTAPLYTRPEDLATDATTGQPLGRKTADGTTVPYYTRAEIESSNMFVGKELVWVEDAMAAYTIQINGSAKLQMDDGTTMFIGYAGKTDRPYVGLGQSMLDAKILKPSQLSLKSIRKLYKENPQMVKEMMNKNQSYVFFREYDGNSWPSGSLGRKVTGERSLATDKKIYPRAGVVLVNTDIVTLTAKKPFQQFMLDQDTGGAIQAPGRADIYMGIGPSAEILAGGQYAEGRLYYFFLKPDAASAVQ